MRKSFFYTSQARPAKGGMQASTLSAQETRGEIEKAQERPKQPHTKSPRLQRRALILFAISYKL